MVRQSIIKKDKNKKTLNFLNSGPKKIIASKSSVLIPDVFQPLFDKCKFHWQPDGQTVPASAIAGDLVHSSL